MDTSIDKQLDNLEISDCDSLQVEFLLEDYNHNLWLSNLYKNITLKLHPKTEIIIQDIDDLVFNVPTDGLQLENVTFINIAKIQSAFNSESKIIEILGISYQDLYLYLLIATAALLIFCIAVAIPSIIFCVKQE